MGSGLVGLGKGGVRNWINRPRGASGCPHRVDALA